MLSSIDSFGARISGHKVVVIKMSKTRTARYRRCLLCAYVPLVESSGSKRSYKRRLTDETDITGFVAGKGLKKSLRYVKEEIDLAAVRDTS